MLSIRSKSMMFHLVSVFLVLAAPPSFADEAVDRLIAALRDPSAEIRTAAWRGAAPLGSKAVKPLAELMMHVSAETAQSAKNALETIMFHAGSPENTPQRREVGRALADLLLVESYSTAVLTDILRFLSWIGDDSVAPDVARVLDNAYLADAALACLEKIPGTAADNALIASLDQLTGQPRHRAIHALANRKVEAAIPRLTEIARKDPIEDRRHALAALAEFGVLPLQATPRRHDQLAASYADWTLTAGYALLEQGEADRAARAFASVFRLTNSPHLIAAALDGMGRSNSPYFLRQSLGYLNEPALRPEILRILAESDFAGLDAELARAFESGDPPLKSALLHVFAARENERARDVVEQARSDAYAEVRFTAYWAEGETPPEDVVRETALRGSYWPRREAVELLSDQAQRFEIQEDKNAARLIYEFLAGDGLPLDVRVGALDELARLAMRESLPFVEELRAESAREATAGQPRIRVLDRTGPPEKHAGQLARVGANAEVPNVQSFPPELVEALNRAYAAITATIRD